MPPAKDKSIDAFRKGLILAVLLVLPACGLRPRPLSSIPTVDADASDETKALFINLWTLARTDHTLFGHMDDTAFGVGWQFEDGRSDVLETAGSYPAVYGWDVGEIELGGATNIDGVPFDYMRRQIIEAYQRGGVNTVSWHMTNPVTLENFYDTSGRPVLQILPGLSQHDRYLEWLDAFADFALSLRSGPTPWNPEEHLVPIVFRPFHEHNGPQFWWGRPYTSEAEFRVLWRFTVEYLRDERGVHNLLYAYSPDARFFPRDGFFPGTYDQDEFRRAYFFAYPGDEYVDVFGLDNYEDPWHRRQGPYQQALEFLIELTHDRSDLKIPALTETGVETIRDDDWWTNFLLRSIRGSRSTSEGQIAWALVWRNWDAEHFQAPYPEHASAEDFRDFADSPFILLEDDIGLELYRWPQ